MRSADPRCTLAGILVMLVCGCAQAPGAPDRPWPNTPAGDGAPAKADPAAAKTDPGALARVDETSVPAPVLGSYEAALQLMRENQLEAAEKALGALIVQRPELGGPHANLGIVLRRTDRMDKAVAELETAVKCNPRQPVFWNQLGITYRLQGQIGKAREAYEHAIEIDPGYPSPILNLGILFDLYLWDSKRALELYDRYLALTPGGDPKVTKWIADLNHRGREQAAQRKEQE